MVGGDVKTPRGANEKVGVLPKTSAVVLGAATAGKTLVDTGAGEGLAKGAGVGVAAAAAAVALNKELEAKRGTNKAAACAL